MDSDAVELKGQVCIVTGGGRGIGRAIVLALAGAGAKVAAVARSEDQLVETASLAPQGSVHTFPGDVSSRADVERIADEVEAQIGTVDLLVNNAGVHGPLGPIWELDPEEWWSCLEINLKGAMMFSTVVLKGMVDRNRGRIIIVYSGAGLRPFLFLSAYCNSKTAMIRLTEQTAWETKEYGISVFSMGPGIDSLKATAYPLLSSANNRDSIDLPSKATSRQCQTQPNNHVRPQEHLLFGSYWAGRPPFAS